MQLESQPEIFIKLLKSQRFQQFVGKAKAAEQNLRLPFQI